LAIDPDEAAVLIQGVLDDARSWRGTRRWRFELAPVGEAATLHAYIVTPTTTDRLCAPYLTRGEVSCQNGNRVVLNAKRWLLGADSYGSDLTNYVAIWSTTNLDTRSVNATLTARIRGALHR